MRLRKRDKREQREFSWIFVITISFIFMTWMIAIYLTLQSPNNESIFFDAIVALFTGVAFTGVIYSLHLQREDLQLNREELKINREEIARNREEIKGQREELQRQLFDQHFQFMLLTFSKKVDLFSETYLTEEYVTDLNIISLSERIVLSEAQFITKFTPDRLNAIKSFNDILSYYDQHYQFSDKTHSASLYMMTLAITAQLSSLVRVMNKLDLEHENFTYLQPTLKKAMQNVLTLTQKYQLVPF